MPKITHAAGSKYRPSHDESVIQLWLSGKWPGEIAAHFGVTLDTIDHWRDVHPSFDAAYVKGQTQAGEGWLRLPMTDEKLVKLRNNPNYYNLITSQIYKIGKVKRRLKGNESAEELLRIAVDLSSRGEGATTQVQTLLEAAMTKVKIDERNEFEKRIQMLENKVSSQFKN